MCPNVYNKLTRRVGSVDVPIDTACLTTAMLGDGLKAYLGEDEWVYAPGMYPRIKALKDEPASIAAATPVYLAVVTTAPTDTDDVLTVNHDFTTGQGTSANEVEWIVRHGDDIVTVSGNSYSLNSGARGVVELHAAVQDSVYKKVELFVGLDTPYLIINEKELAKFRDGINSRSYFYYDDTQDTFALVYKTGLQTVPVEGEAATFILTKDLDLESNQWTPIGHDSAIFKGNFNGNDHVIKNLYVEDHKNNAFAGLFGRVSNGYIKRLGLINPEVKATGIVAVVGGIAAYSCGRIDSCYTEGGFIEGRDYTGGICGWHNGYWYGTTGDYILNDTTRTIMRCYNNAEIAGSYYVGGIAGYDYNAIYWCYNRGEVHTRNVDDRDCRTGGICGGTSYYVIESFNMGVVKGSKLNALYTGGVLGEYRAVRSYNVGEVIGNKSLNTGGITAEPMKMTIPLNIRLKRSSGIGLQSSN